MSRPTLWWRLLSLWGATLAGLGLTRSLKANPAQNSEVYASASAFW